MFLFARCGHTFWGILCKEYFNEFNKKRLSFYFIDSVINVILIKLWGNIQLLTYFLLLFICVTLLKPAYWDIEIKFFKLLNMKQTKIYSFFNAFSYSKSTINQSNLAKWNLNGKRLQRLHLMYNKRWSCKFDIYFEWCKGVNLKYMHYSLKTRVF